MKLGMNLFLWTTNVDKGPLFPVFRLKDAGFEGVKIPIGRSNHPISREKGVGFKRSLWDSVTAD